MKKNSHGPVIYLDPETLLPTCNPSLCKDKLVNYYEVKETNYKWVGGPVKHKFYYSICNQCNKRTITNSDKKFTDISYKAGIKNQGIDPSLTEEEMNEKTQNY